MAQAVQVNTTAAVPAVLAGNNPQWETVIIANLGPNAIYFDMDGAATVAGSIPIPATTGTVTIRRPPNTAISLIAATALQVSPADTRIEKAPTDHRISGPHRSRGGAG